MMVRMMVRMMLRMMVMLMVRMMVRASRVGNTGHGKRQDTPRLMVNARVRVRVRVTVSVTVFQGQRLRANVQFYRVNVWVIDQILRVIDQI